MPVIPNSPNPNSDADADASADDAHEVDEITETEEQEFKQFLALMHGVSIDDITNVMLDSVKLPDDSSLPNSLAMLQSEQASTPTPVIPLCEDEAFSTLPKPEWVTRNFRTTSAMIRFYGTYTQDCTKIATLLGIKYQHVRNVLKTPLKRGANEDFTRHTTNTNTDK